MASAETSVRVSVRIRPIMGKEKLEGCVECVRPLSSTELLMEGKDKQFTFDHVFGKESHQREIYSKTVSQLVKSLFDGYNATVLAYGQTGSGKTYTMGTSSNDDLDDENIGVVPRAMKEIFDIIEERKESHPGAEFYLRVQFLEVYGEEMRDLLDPTEGKSVTIREGKTGGEVVVEGAREETVKSTAEMLGCLERGALCRTTGATQMNFHSSRSHAIFTIIVEQHLPIQGDSNEAAVCASSSEPPEKASDDADGPEDGESRAAPADEQNIEYRTAKFHFVDLAGSERAKRTGAEGKRLAEGININRGLLALGNVISALGDETKQGQHVPYRNSKLTRMLQDSLGGNSRTLMIACVSPADSNIEETLSALRYANRARNIKNKPVVNRDPQSSQVAFLKMQIAQLRAQLQAGGVALPPALQALGSGSCMSPSSAFASQGRQQQSSYGAAFEESERLRQRCEDAESEMARLQEALQREKRQRSELDEKYVLVSAERDYLSDKLGASDESQEDKGKRQEAIGGIAEYLRRISDLERTVQEKDSELLQSRRDMQTLRAELNVDEALDDVEKEIIRKARMRKSIGMRLDTVELPVLESPDRDNSARGRAASSGSGESESPHAADDEIAAIREKANASDVLEMSALDDDDEETRAIKEKYIEQQESFKKMVMSYDDALRNKHAAMQVIVQERKRYESMKAHYESKLQEMNAEVAATQKQRDDLDARIKSLEAGKEGKAGSEANKAAIAKLRVELKSKTERLKTLEVETRELQETKKRATQLERQELRVRSEIDALKAQKVEYQKKLEENSKRYREEAAKRMNEIAQLRKKQQLLSKDNTNLKSKGAQNERMLKAKAEQLAGLQRKLRLASRLQAHNKNLTDKEQKQRQLLSKWASERQQQADELERLQRSVQMKEAAIAKKEKIIREMEQYKKAAELRAKVAEETAKNALLDKSAAEKASVETYFPHTRGGSAAATAAATDLPEKADLTPEERESFQDLRDRLEAVEFEISFQEKVVEEAAANIPDDAADLMGVEDHESTSSRPRQRAEDFTDSLLNVGSISEAKERLEGLLHMWFEVNQEKAKALKQLEELREAQEQEVRVRVTQQRRKSLLPLTQATSPGFKRHLAPGSPHAASSATDQILQQLRDENSLLQAKLLQAQLIHAESQNQIQGGHARNPSSDQGEETSIQVVAQLTLMEDQLRSQAVPSQHDGGSRRSSLNFAAPATPPLPGRGARQPLDSEICEEAPGGLPASVAKGQGKNSAWRQSTSSSSTGVTEQSSALQSTRLGGSPEKHQDKGSLAGGSNVYDRLHDQNNWTGAARARARNISDKPYSENPRARRDIVQTPTLQHEIIVDKITHEAVVDEYNGDSEAYESIQNAASAAAAAAASAVEADDTNGCESPKSGSPGKSSPPRQRERFAAPTKSYELAQAEKKNVRRNKDGKKRDSQGSEGSGAAIHASSPFTKKAFCSTAGSAKSKQHLAMTESSLASEYRSEGNGLYRAASGRRKGQGAPLPWNDLSGNDSSPPKLTEVDNLERRSPSSAGSKSRKSPKTKEKENAPRAALDKPQTGSAFSGTQLFKHKQENDRKKKLDDALQAERLARRTKGAMNPAK